MIDERFRTRLENIIIIFYPPFSRKCVGVEDLVAGFFCYRDVVGNRLHIRVPGSEELCHGGGDVFAEPAQFAYYSETIRIDRLCPSSQRIGKTDVVGCAFCPEKIDYWKHSGNVVHIHAMRPYQVSDAFLGGAPLQALQEWLVGIYSLNWCPKLVRQHRGLTARAAAGVHHDIEAVLGKRTQNIHSGGIVTRT